jgi:dsDNA-specific endonuclease/ATPase MutS2
MLEIQLAEFEKRLDAAILASADEVTFIHGVGNGTLRHEIQKRLGKHPHVQFFQDAKKERFGYGATSATLK